MPSVDDGVSMRHIAGMGDLGGDESRCAAHDVEYGGIVGAACLIDEFVYGEARVRLERERGFIVESDAQRTVNVGLQHVGFVDRVAERKRAGGIVARDRGAPLQRRDAADRMGVGCAVGAAGWLAAGGDGGVAGGAGDIGACADGPAPLHRLAPARLSPKPRRCPK